MDIILPLLRNNARASVSDLAKSANITETEVVARIAKLEADGVVLGYLAVVDPQKVSKDRVAALIEVKLTPEREGGFERQPSASHDFPRW